MAEIDKTKIDLNKPAFGKEAQKLSDLVPAPAGEEAKEEENKPQEKQEDKPIEEKKEEGQNEDSEEKPRVTYSRFENVNRKRREAEEQAERWKLEAERLAAEKNQPKEQKADEGEIPSWWLELYGDSDASKKAYRITKENNDKFLSEAEERLLARLKEEQEAERKAVSDNISRIEDGLDNLADNLGRDLSEKEQSDILDIINEFTPKDSEGNYLGAPLPFDRAWEIHELRTKSAEIPQKKAKENIAKLTSGDASGSQSSEEDQERNKNFNPFDWDSYKKRIGK